MQTPSSLNHVYKNQISKYRVKLRSNKEQILNVQKTRTGNKGCLFQKFHHREISRIHVLFASVYDMKDVIIWKHFPRYWPIVWGIHRSPVNSPHKGQWGGALMFSLIYACINVWANHRKAGDMRRHRIHYDVTVMTWNLQKKRYRHESLLSCMLKWAWFFFYYIRELVLNSLYLGDVNYTIYVRHNATRLKSKRQARSNIIILLNRDKTFHFVGFHLFLIYQCVGVNETLFPQSVSVRKWTRQTVEKSVFIGAMPLMWCHCNEIGSFRWSSHVLGQTVSELRWTLSKMYEHHLTNNSPVNMRLCNIEMIKFNQSLWKVHRICTGMRLIIFLLLNIDL